jgi:carbonic anhydrase
MPDISKLVSGYRDFRATVGKDYKENLMHLMRQDITPTTMVVTTSDLPIPPARLLSTNPGELYVLHNLGGLVPPFGSTFARGVVSAIQHAVGELGVGNIIVLGHSHNRAVKTMLRMKRLDVNAKNAMEGWLAVAKDAKESVLSQLPNATLEEQEKALEQELVLLSVRNLLTYPWIQKRVDGVDGNAPELDVFGWYFDTHDGMLYGFDPEQRDFVSLA